MKQATRGVLGLGEWSLHIVYPGFRPLAWRRLAWICHAYFCVLAVPGSLQCYGMAGGVERSTASHQAGLS
eukprot:5209794-Amphidinium_carterae.1